MALSRVALSGTYIDGLGNALGGQVLFVPNVPLIDTTDQQLLRQAAITITLDPDGHFSVPLVATDNVNLAPDGWCWTVKEMVTGIAPYAWSFFLPFEGGASQDISSLDAVTIAPAVAQYMPIGGGTFTGAVTLSGAPTTSLMAATKHYVDTETTRATAAEATKFPIAGGTVTGAIALAGNPSAALQAAPKQYVDAETTRAEAAEALLLPLAGGTVTGPLVLTGTSPLQITHGAGSGDILMSNGTGQASWQASGLGVTLDTTHNPQALGTVAAGTGTNGASASDHVHPTTSIINGVTVSGTPALNKTIMCTSGSAATWATAAAGVTLDTSDTPAALSGSGTPGTSGMASAADHAHPTTNVINGVTVSGSPGAGLQIICTSSSAASWGSSSVINGVTVSGTPGSGKIIVCTSGSAASWSPLTDSSAGDIAALAASAAAGSVGTPADAGHIHPTTGLALLAGAAFTGAVSTAKVLSSGVFALTDTGTISVDASQGNTFRVTLGGNRTLGNPTNATVDGQMILFEIKQDGTGGRTLAFGTNYIFGTDITTPTLSSTAGAVDVIGFKLVTSTGKWRCLAVSHGYAS